MFAFSINVVNVIHVLSHVIIPLQEYKRWAMEFDDESLVKQLSEPDVS